MKKNLKTKLLVLRLIQKNILDFNADEHPREGVDLETLSRLKPVFKKDVTVTAGNASGINDGAAAITIMSKDESEKEKLKDW